jgi:Fe2+ transport system protein FeoA
MSRTSLRVAGVLLVAVLVSAGCSSSDDEAGPSDNTSSSTSVGPSGNDGTTVDRSSRFAKADTFCEPATDESGDKPTATDDGITADSIAITHIRVTLEDLAGLGFAIPIGDPVDQAKRFVGLVNDRCGGIHGRKLKLSLVEAPPLAPSGQDPASVAQAACIKATEDQDAVFAFSGSGWGGQGGAACVTGAHDTVYLTTYNISQEDLEGAENRLYSFTLSSADGLEYLARRLVEKGLLEGKTIGVVMGDGPGDPEIVEQGLLNTLDELGVDVKRVDTIGCVGGNSCTTGVIESVRGMITDGVDVLFPLLNVISLPGYLGEMVTQGVKPGQFTMYQSGYNAQSGDLVSSKVVTFGGPKAGALYNGTLIVSNGATGAFRLPGFKPGEYGEMCNREYQAAGGEKYSAIDPASNSAYGATVGMCTFIRTIARAVEAAGVNPTREDLAAAVEGLGALAVGEDPATFGPGKYTAPTQLYEMKFNYPCAKDKSPFDGMCIITEGDAFPIPAAG